jgi:glutathione S-transferase
MRQLYHTSFSPSCRKIRFMLNELQLEYKLIDEPVWEQRPEFLQINAGGDLPVLIDANELILCGSYVIMEYLEEGYRTDFDNSLFGADLATRAEVRRLVHWCDSKLLKEVTQPLLHEKYFRSLLKAGQPDTKRIRYAKTMLDKHMQYFENLLSHHEWLAGDKFSIADIAVASHFSLHDYLSDINWQHNSAVKKWYALVKSRPAFRKIMKDRVRGIKPPAHYEDPDF